MKQLKGNKNIKNIIRYDIKGDELSNPKDDLAFLKAIKAKFKKAIMLINWMLHVQAVLPTN